MSDQEPHKKRFQVQVYQHRFELLLFFVSLGLLLYSYKVAVAGIQVQMEEMEWRLQESEYLENESSHLHLVIKYTSQRQLYRDSISQKDLDLLEFELRNQYKEISQTIPDLKKSHDYFQRMAIRFINLKRSLTNEVLFPGPDRKLNVRYLNLAYQMERNREYQRALVLYNLMLEKPLPADIIGGVRLHKAFCLAILGQDEAARELYLQLMSEYQGDNIGITATQLLDFLNEFEGEETKIANSQMDHRSKAVYLTKLLKCEEALQAIAEASSLSAQDASYLNYYKGICLEEMGEKTEAIQAYGKSIASSGNSEVAKDANRRIFMIASESRKSQPLRDMSLRLNRVLQDSALDSLKKIDTLASNQDSFVEKEMFLEKETSDTLLDLSVSIHVDSIEKAIRSNLQNAKSTSVEKPVRAGIIGPDVKVRVLTLGGKAFYGTLLNRSDEKIIRIKTMIGTLPIKQSEIKSVQQVN